MCVVSLFVMFLLVEQCLICFSLLVRFVALAVFNFCPTLWLAEFNWNTLLAQLIPETFFWVTTIVLIFLQIPKISSKVMKSSDLESPLIDMNIETPRLYADY